MGEHEPVGGRRRLHALRKVLLVDTVGDLDPSRVVLRESAESEIFGSNDHLCRFLVIARSARAESRPSRRGWSVRCGFAVHSSRKSATQGIPVSRATSSATRWFPYGDELEIEDGGPVATCARKAAASANGIQPIPRQAS